MSRSCRLWTRLKTSLRSHFRTWGLTSRQVGSESRTQRGWDGPGEPALAVTELKDELRQYASDNPGHGFAVVECGQFQCYVGAYRRATEGKDEA